jgi:murein L,D-transpeptidase YcbB/YkuD
MDAAEARNHRPKSTLEGCGGSAGRRVKVVRSLARAAAFAFGAIVLAACGTDTPAPDTPAALAAIQESPTAIVSAPAPPVFAYADSELGSRIKDPSATVAGERLNVELLRRFYARRGYTPVWADRQSQADSLVKAVLSAGDHGLSPDLFHASALRSRATLPAHERELLLSSAFLSYADALARGAMPIERRKDNQILSPEPVDVAAVLAAAADSGDPAAVIEALAPTTPTYRVLRRALRSAAARTREIEVNLERERWLPRRLPAERVWVNVPDGRLVLYRNEQPVFSTRVIVGQDEKRKQSPEFQTTIHGTVFNPPWNIPEDIAKADILPKAAADPTYLARHKMIVLPNGGVQQVAGDSSALGHLMFEMNNRFDVYLHDTPSRDLFARDSRRFSNGCIRVEKPRELAALLMHQPTDDIDQVIATGSTTRRDLPRPVPVFIAYQTAFADLDGVLQYRADVYGRDAEIWQYLNPKRRAVAAVRVAGLGR